MHADHKASFDANRALWDVRAPVHGRDATGYYKVERLLAGEDVLLPIEAAEIGDVRGLRIAHLQCHIGLDSICLARRGASVTGLDFSPASIALARRFTAQAGADVTFVEGNVYDARALLPGDFDMVYTTWGTIIWLPDLAGWARTIASLLRPGGWLYFADGHPAADCLDLVDGRLVLASDWRTPADRPLVDARDTTYTGEATARGESHEWIHPVADIVSALAAAGLRLDWMHEHPVLMWRRFPVMVEGADRMFRFPAGFPQVPLALSFKATKA